MDGDEAQDSGQVTEGLQREEEQVEEELDEGEDPPVAREAQVVVNHSTHSIIGL